MKEDVAGWGKGNEARLMRPTRAAWERAGRASALDDCASYTASGSVSPAESPSASTCSGRLLSERVTAAWVAHGRGWRVSPQVQTNGRRASLANTSMAASSEKCSFAPC